MGCLEEDAVVAEGCDLQVPFLKIPENINTIKSAMKSLDLDTLSFVWYISARNVHEKRRAKYETVLCY